MSSTESGGQEEVKRRDFLVVSTAAFGGVGVVVAAWPFVHQMNPSADVLALSSIEVDISGIAEGQSLTVKWRGKPVFIRHRTPAEIEAARAVDLADLPDPESDEARAPKPNWLIVVGVSTHLGCIPIGRAGEYGGWFCPCHGSHYDTSARIRKGPAPENLAVPAYEFLSDTMIRIG